MAELAARIWRNHYTPIIGEAQVEYMLDKFQSAEAIGKQIDDGYDYRLIVDAEGKDVGYFGVVPRKNELFLSKLYILCGNRGKGYGRRAVEEVSKLAKKLKLPKITLTVNKNNADSIKAYEKFGFKIKDSVVNDIGSGFVMDDYVMEKTI